MLREKITKINLKCSLAIFQWTKTYELASLYEPAFGYIERCFSFLTDDKNFLKISFTNLKKILNSSQLNVDFELEVYRLAEEWLKHDIGERGRLAKDLLRSVRLNLLSQQTLEHLLEEPSPFTEIDECRAVLERAVLQEEIRQGKTPQGETFKVKTFNPRVNARHCSQAAFDVLVLGGRQTSSGSQVRSVNRVVEPKLIKSLAPMMTRRSNLEAVLVRGEIFVLGGGGTDVKHNFVEKYSPISGRWEKVTGMPDAREEYCVCAFMHKVYVFGGCGQSNSTASILELDTTKKKWRRVASMGDSRHLAACCVFQGKIVVTGGIEADRWFKESNHLSSSDCFDVLPDGELSEWPMPDMLARLHSHRFSFFLLKLCVKPNFSCQELITAMKNVCFPLKKSFYYY